ncbi:MAG: hypothetical protein ACO3A4_10485 [Silvanigrellaceae bacterium]
MGDWWFLLLSAFSGGVVAVGLFIQVAAVTRQRRTFKGVLLKFLGLVPLLFAVWGAREQIYVVSGLFFSTALIFLVFLTLARNKLLR